MQLYSVPKFSQNNDVDLQACMHAVAFVSRSIEWLPLTFRTDEQKNLNSCIENIYIYIYSYICQAAELYVQVSL